MGGVLFTDKSGADVQLIFLPLLRDFKYTEQLSWGSVVLAHLYRELCRASKVGAKEIAGPLILLQVCMLVYILSYASFNNYVSLTLYVIYVSYSCGHGSDCILVALRDLEAKCKVQLYQIVRM